MVALLVVLGSIACGSVLLLALDYHARDTEAKRKKECMLQPNRLIRATHVIAGSVVGNFTALFGKAFSGLLVYTISGNDQFTDPFVIVIVLVFVVSLPLQIFLINASLAVNDLLYHIPNFYVFWNVGNILTGAIFYEETTHFSGQNWALFLSGVAILFVGIFFTNVAAVSKQNSKTSWSSIPQATQNTTCAML